MNHSSFSRKFGDDCGILQLMDDLGQFAGREDMIMLGGGNPSRIPAVESYFRDRMARILDSESDFEEMIGSYPGPGGESAFLEAVATFFHERYGWPITAANVALTNGSQTAFFMLFNMFGGDYPDGSHKKILLPLAPEYIGYEDVGLSKDLFVSFRPEIAFLPNRMFKYHVDFAALHIDDSIGAICVSRPTNPTGNVLDEEEMAKLSELAKQNNIPFIVDNAYGLPFPSIIFTEAEPTWEPHVIMCMSLSKLGLPGARTGIIIAHEAITRQIAGMNAVISLAPGNFGANLALEAIRSADVLRLSHDIIRPHYEAKVKQAVAWLHHALDGIDYYIHVPEGAIFVWVWFRDLPIDSQALYERLKAERVLVIPGHHFFPGLADEWKHKTECIRVNYAMEGTMVKAGIEIIGQVVKEAYQA